MLGQSRAFRRRFARHELQASLRAHVRRDDGGVRATRARTRRDRRRGGAIVRDHAVARGGVSRLARDVRARPADVRIARRPAAPPGMDARPGVLRRGRSGRGGSRPAAEHREGIHRALLPELLHAVAEQAPARDLGERRRRGGARPRGRGRAHQRARRRRPDFRAGAPARQLGEAPGARARRGPRVRPRRPHRGRPRVLGRRRGRAARGRLRRRRGTLCGPAGSDEKSSASASGRRAPPAGARHGDGLPAGR